MNAAKTAVKEFLHSGNHHTVDIDQETKPAVVHERVAQKQHEDITTAIDREVHQHHHQIHVQPIQDQVVLEEKHHHNIIPIEHKQHHHGKTAEVEQTLLSQGKFRDEREVMPVESTSGSTTVVGEHVHHHIHDIIQPVVERETIQPHVVHTTVPIHERIEHEPQIHKGNVLPAMSMDEFTRAGHSLTGFRKAPEHIEYEGEPLKIDGSSHVAFGHGNEGVLGGMGRSGETTGTTGSGYTHQGLGGNNTDEFNNTPRSLNNNTSTGYSGTNAGQNTGSTGPVHSSSLLNKLDPRVKDV